MANRFAKRRVSGSPRDGQPRRPDPSRRIDARNDLFPTDPFAVLRSGKARVRSAAESLPTATRQRLAYAFTDRVVAEYWRGIQSQYLKPFPLPRRFNALCRGRLTPELLGLARSLGTAAARLTPVSAAYFIGTTYASILPKKLRAERGIYYTPPSLAARLLDQAAAAGTDWATASVLDPACGGGAFLAPVAERIAKQLSHLEPSELLGAVERRLRGWEIDPYAAWLAQTTLEAAVLPLCHAAGRRLDVLVDVVNSLRVPSDHRHYDLVIGNPPYGKVTLPPNDRRKFGRSLYGHANLYGLFTDVALRVLTDHGVVAFVTPTSFLAGQYFKRLRGLLGGQAPPLTLDFITERQGVFDDVLQEALLATYRRDSEPVPVAVSFITSVDEVSLGVSSGGWFKLPSNTEDPWLIPRSPEMGPLVERMQRVTGRLRDWGYSVSTGPLVWNRHKGQFSTKRGKGAVPVVWAEAVTANGEFVFRADRRGHRPYFRPKREGDEWLLVKDSCVLLQRTTAKEQRRRLVAAVLPERFLQEHRGAIVENHLNMIRPIVDEPPVAMTAVAAFLNSRIADLVFRCLSGSVAVSAYELEALPLPAASAMRALEHVPEEAGAMEQVWESLYEPGGPEET